MSSTRPQLHFVLLLLAYYSTHTAASGSITVQCLPDQASALLQLKSSFHSPNLSSWQHGVDCCHWEGVSCDMVSGRVITLDLGGRNLRSTGDLNSALFNLTSLTNLSLAGNDFSQTRFPNFGFERLNKLLRLNLSHTRFFGQIPIGIVHLKNLLTLDLSYTDLYFQEPSFHSFIANLSNNLRELNLDEVGILNSEATWPIALADSVPLLQSLSLRYCGLCGPIHHSFSHLRLLVTINLAVNDFSGSVPEFLADFSFLRDLDLSNNNFEGKFPTKIFQLESLRSLDVSSNPGLSVQLPDFPPGNNLEALNLLETNISHAIPASFVHLKSLEFLGVSSTGFPTQATTVIANLPSLDTLWLKGSGLETPMLSWIGRVKHLRDLMLEDYNFSGPIPSWVRNCTGLTSLMLSNCSFSRAIPSWIGNLTKLSNLDFSDNNLSGNIPKYLFALPALQHLILSSNQLSGNLEDIDAPLSSSMYTLSLENNLLSGLIPKSFFQLTSLRYLNLASNHLIDTVELSLLWRLKNLKMLVLSDNMLSVIDGEGPHPSLPNIKGLYLASCNLTKFPAMLRYQYNMQDIDLACNQISGVIPGWIWENSKELHELNLSHNMFTSLEKNPSLVPMYAWSILDLSSNRLRGNVPIPHNGYEGFVLDYSNNSFSSVIPDFGRYLANTMYLDLSKNKLKGHIPVSLCSLGYLQVLDLSYNNFSGLVPSCLIEGSQLGILNLRGNKFYGVLPDNFSDGCVLQIIDLNINYIEGKLPRSLSNCRSLEVLHVGNNQIFDSFPFWLGSLPNLRVLVLRSNELYGSIGTITKGDGPGKHFSGLQIIDLASNNLSGSLQSEWFENLETMMANSTSEGIAQALQENTRLPNEFYQENFTFKGMDLTFTKILTTFKMVDFSNNAFDGAIPESIGKLIALHGLNMSHNAFTGRIPSNLGDLAQLESLDLSWNQLSGPVPQELTSLTSLALLNLSYNNLTGRIPQESQFLSFSNSSFEGNAGLCGRPLSKQCNSSEPSGAATLSPSASSQDSVGVILLFVFVGSGFGVGFAVAFVLSLICRTKRQ